MKKVAVTGISGLLGNNLSNALLQNGWAVKGLLRDKRKFKGQQHNNLELIEGNLFDDLTGIFMGADAVIHIAAETRQNLNCYSAYRVINYNATVKLFNTAIKCGVKKFVFISTANTLGSGCQYHPGTEQHAIKTPFDASLYAKSKLEAEDYLLNNNKGIDVIIINPGFIIGPLDTKPSSGKIILMGWKKKVVFYPPGGKNFVSVHDVVAGIINSLKNGCNGEKYLLVNQNLSYLQFFKELNNVANQNPVMIKIPKTILMLAGYIGDVLRFCKIPTAVSSVNMKILCTSIFYSNAKSATHLKINYQPIGPAIKEAIAYFERAM